MEFIEKKQLKKQYRVFGKFYILNYDTKVNKCCRSILEIFEKNNYSRLKETRNIDAIFVMMNPGKGRPIKKYDCPNISLSEIKNGKLGEIELVEMEPDDTQYQVMRIMKEMNWKYIRVINLSDYRSPKSKEFYKMIKEASETFDSEFIHSIFSEQRNQEIDRIFQSNIKFKIIVAWGVNTKLHKLIQLAIENRNICERIGNTKDTYKSKKRKNFYYYHPLQREKSKQILWLEKIIKKLKS
ncbi:DUF1643 domain-containing protein [Clostridium tyrobutyricum]|uniref:DUF1643 domain-containing protein n=1 Tax=Clostridium tyrobutyricum TaxID=1519 RepID=UPI0039F70F5E